MHVETFQPKGGGQENGTCVFFFILETMSINSWCSIKIINYRSWPKIQPVSCASMNFNLTYLICYLNTANLSVVWTLYLHCEQSCGALFKPTFQIVTEIFSAQTASWTSRPAWILLDPRFVCRRDVCAQNNQSGRTYRNSKNLPTS